MLWVCVGLVVEANKKTLLQGVWCLGKEFFRVIEGEPKRVSLARDNTFGSLLFT